MNAEQVAKMYLSLVELERVASKPYSILADIDELMVVNSKKETILSFKQSVTRLSGVSSSLALDSELQAVWDNSLSTQVKFSVARLKRLGE